MKISEKKFYQISLLLPVIFMIAGSLCVLPEILGFDKGICHVPEFVAAISIIFTMGATTVGVPYIILSVLIVYKSTKNELEDFKKDLVKSPFILIGFALPFSFIIHPRGGIGVWLTTIPFVLVIGYMFVLLTFQVGNIIYKKE